MKLNLSLAVLLILAFCASLLAGRVWLPPSALLSPHDSLAGLIVQDIRLPRTVLALIVGAVLGLSGAVLQGFTRNPLAEPALLGVSSLGEAQAQSLGVNIARLAALVVAGTALSVGAITSVTGAIGFIGLVAPHLVRPFVGYAPRRVLLPATLAGALLLLCADIAARLVHTNPELRLGVFTSLLGTPFFFWLVVRIRKVAP